jgi:hypothetical protein
MVLAGHENSFAVAGDGTMPEPLDAGDVGLPDHVRAESTGGGGVEPQISTIEW